MKKRTINAFTLVEMLIVIVIIGILIAALMPRMQAAQGRARDVSRKTALSQVQSAIVTSQGDKGKWPGVCDSTRNFSCATGGIGLDAISGDLTTAGMNSVPTDPLKSKVTGMGVYTGDAAGNYGYIVTKRNGTKMGGFALMAKTEVEGGSNWVVCPNGSGKLTEDTDIAKITLCDKLIYSGSSCSNDGKGNCYYTGDAQLRYLVIY